MEQKPNKKLLQRRQTMTLLIESATIVFEEKGFEGANLADITGAANAAAGVLNKWFGNKERLAAHVMLSFLKHTSGFVGQALAFEDDPILYALAMVTTNYSFMMQKWGYRTFFIDSLRHDFILNHLMNQPSELIIRLIRWYKPGADVGKIALYSEYMPYMLGRTLIIKKEEGLFGSTPYDEIPFLMVNESLHHFVPEAKIRARAPEALRIARELVEALPHRPSTDTVEKTILALE